MNWYRFRQNNTGGSFTLPGVEVFIEATDANDAEARATYLGMTNEGSCPCCGDRWNGCTQEAPPDVAEVGYLGQGVYERAPAYAVKFAYGDDAGVALPTRQQTREEYMAEMAAWRARSEARRREQS